MQTNVKGFLISESTTEPEKPIIVSNKEDRRIIIKTTLQDTDVVNRNKRMYPKGVIEKGLQSDYIRERLATKTWFGEAGEYRMACLQ